MKQNLMAKKICTGKTDIGSSRKQDTANKVSATPNPHKVQETRDNSDLAKTRRPLSRSFYLSKILWKGKWIQYAKKKVAC